MSSRPFSGFMPEARTCAMMDALNTSARPDARTVCDVGLVGKACTLTRVVLHDDIHARVGQSVHRGRHQCHACLSRERLCRHSHDEASHLQSPASSQGWFRPSRGIRSSPVRHGPRYRASGVPDPRLRLLLEQSEHHAVRILEHRESACSGDRHRLDDRLAPELFGLAPASPRGCRPRRRSSRTGRHFGCAKQATTDAAVGRPDEAVPVHLLFPTSQDSSPRRPPLSPGSVTQPVQQLTSHRVHPLRWVLLPSAILDRADGRKTGRTACLPGDLRLTSGSARYRAKVNRPSRAPCLG